MADHRFTVDEIIEASRSPVHSSVEALVGGQWVVARPLHCEPWPWRIRRRLRRLFRVERSETPSNPPHA